MLIRYRILTGEVTEKTLESTVASLDVEAAEGLKVDLLRPRRRHAGAFESTVLAYFEAPREVTEKEGEAEPERLEAMIAKRQMAPTDLVYTGDGCWIEARQHPLLEEVCQYIEGKNRWLRVRNTALTLLLVAAGIVVLALLPWEE